MVGMSLTGSSPSYRYAYLLWMVLAVIALIYAAAHHLRLSRGSLGAGYTRWGMRRTTIGSQKPGARNRSLPSNNVLVGVAVIAIATIVLSIIGSDYIAPSTSVLDFATLPLRRDTNPAYTISKAFWTSGSRLGDMAFSLMPLVVLLALKSPPIAVLSLRALTHLWADKLAIIHRAVAWLIWALTTIHVILWTIQLFRDQLNGKAAWISMWSSYRFIFGCVAYGALTAVMLFSLRPVRKARYEVSFLRLHSLTTVLLSRPRHFRLRHHRSMRSASSSIVVLDGRCCCALGSGTCFPLRPFCPNQCPV